MENISEKENKKLRAELTLLKANLSKLEKENSNLRMEKSKFILNKIEIESELKKKLENKEKESRIIENQRKMFKSNVQESSCFISPKFALERMLSFTDIKTNSFLKNLRFFKDFFFDDFYSITDEKADEIVDFFQKQTQKEFVDSFDIFCCKKFIFSKYCPSIFNDNSFINIKTQILSTIEPEWIVEMLDSGLNRFIDRNENILTTLFASFAEKYPFHLKSILNKETFDELLPNVSQNKMIYKLVYFIVKHKITPFIDHTNIHLVPKDFVIYFYDLDDNSWIDLGC